MYIEKIELVGLALSSKTTNANGQSVIDCGNLWQKFEKENYLEKISGRINDDIIAVYHEYEGDHTKPFSYFIGCKVRAGGVIPRGMTALTIMSGNYHKETAKGEIPFCITEAWNVVWKSDLKRTYQTDFEVYDTRSKEWKNGEVDLYVSVFNN